MGGVAGSLLESQPWPNVTSVGYFSASLQFGGDCWRALLPVPTNFPGAHGEFPLGVSQSLALLLAVDSENSQEALALDLEKAQCRCSSACSRIWHHWGELADLERLSPKSVS